MSKEEFIEILELGLTEQSYSLCNKMLIEREKEIKKICKKYKIDFKFELDSNQSRIQMIFIKNIMYCIFSTNSNIKDRFTEALNWNKEFLDCFKTLP